MKPQHDNFEAPAPRSHSRRARPTLSAALSCAALLAFTLAPHVRAQSGGAETIRAERIVEQAKDFKPPVSITVVKSGAGAVDFGRPFEAGGDWFKGLTFSVRNDSGKPLTYVRLSVGFRRDGWQSHEPEFVKSLEYGSNPLPVRNSRAPFETASPLPHGESVELGLAEGEYETVGAALMEANYPAVVRRVRVSVQMLGFKDGTVWTGGRMYKPARGKSWKLIPLDANEDGSVGR